MIPLLWAKDVMKLALAKDGLFILSQVHPEIIAQKNIGEILSKKKAFLTELKKGIESIDGEYDSMNKVQRAVLSNYVKFIEDDYFNDTLEFVGVDTKGDHNYSYFGWSNKRAYDHIFKDKQKICNQIDTLINAYQLAESKFEMMVKFSHHLFGLFFDHVNHYRLQKEDCLEVKAILS
ncbi:hypothetical protein [Candidatus Neptunochlamydia vexilliferae]|uniref:hypothetical protein n=1 Tax=Candidatus Neptunichlamydia vexilliferae TaxID=1651774 RepID=UPI0018917C2F|nr:hypothetical protein [Candidatus Neptunochlamydia vexilliferae]